MTKSEAIDFLTKNGELNNHSHTWGPAWDTLFKLYSAETGDRTLSQTCGSCYEKVRKWAKRS